MPITRLPDDAELVVRITRPRGAAARAAFAAVYHDPSNMPELRRLMMSVTNPKSTEEAELRVRSNEVET